MLKVYAKTGPITRRATVSTTVIEEYNWATAEDATRLVAIERSKGPKLQPKAIMKRPAPIVSKPVRKVKIQVSTSYQAQIVASTNKKQRQYFQTSWREY